MNNFSSCFGSASALLLSNRIAQIKFWHGHDSSLFTFISKAKWIALQRNVINLVSRLKMKWYIQDGMCECVCSSFDCAIQAKQTKIYFRCVFLRDVKFNSRLTYGKCMKWPNSWCCAVRMFIAYNCHGPYIHIQNQMLLVFSVHHKYSARNDSHRKWRSIVSVLSPLSNGFHQKIKTLWHKCPFSVSTNLEVWWHMEVCFQFLGVNWLIRLFANAFMHK